MHRNVSIANVHNMLQPCGRALMYLYSTSEYLIRYLSKFSSRNSCQLSVARLPRLRTTLVQTSSSNLLVGKGGLATEQGFDIANSKFASSMETFSPYYRMFDLKYISKFNDKLVRSRKKTNFSYLVCLQGYEFEHLLKFF